ncbi:NACHT domain-containing protein [Massilia sp. CFBP9026]|uniref:phosphorylase family protein n=1 Tax=Massilia sp. CFBP9026 TaxID=3096536 RepID=UPI002A699FA0|nr:NACHT domain-containing protein [Massilia sp. CFBP9026]MDY0965091.1 NACHT domain-containing protein [Massilia sp. CFBP9026]
MKPNLGRKPLILCITETEYAAVKVEFHEGTREVFRSVVLEHGFLGGRPVTVCKFSEMGSRGGDSVAHRLPEVLEYVSPTFVVELGICFGLKDDVKIGDVAICQYSADYELQKVNPGSKQFRIRTTKADPGLYSQLLSFAARNTFAYDVVGAIYASGDKVVNSPVLKRQILRAIPDAKCGDMESYALGVACDNKRIPWLVIKASSDDGVNKGDEFQNSAAAASVDFFVSFLGKADDIESYFDVPYEVDFHSGAEFEYISREIFNGTPIKVEAIDNNRTNAIVHYHPEVEDEWVIVYISKAHSIPETLRTILRRFSHCPSRIEVCIASGANMTSANHSAYTSILQEAGCKKPSVLRLGDFIFNRIVAKRTFSLPVNSPGNYVDQVVYRGDAKLASGRIYAENFLSESDGNRINLKPIAVILGQGGVGKTTFCRSLVNLINANQEFSKRVLLITKSDIMKNFSGDSVKSIADLYKEYTRGSGSQIQSITQQGFKLALSSGSLVVMIDGIDEIESALAEKFDMESFANSISELNESLHSCRVLVTSRDANAGRLSDLPNADIIYLKGFLEPDIDTFLAQDKPETKARLKSLFPKIRNDRGFVNPYLLHVARQYIVNGPDSLNPIDTRKLKLTDPFDYVLARCLQREIEKQTLSISIDDYYDLLNEIVVTHHNRIDEASFENYIETCIDDSFARRTDARRDPYLKFFLIEEQSGIISVCHQEYVAQILLNRAAEIFINEGQIVDGHVRSIESIFGDIKNESFGLRERLCQRFTSSEIGRAKVEETLKQLLVKLKLSAPSFRRDRAIYELYLFAFDFYRALSPKERAEILVKFDSSTVIKKLYVLGDFPAVDFSGLVVMDSVFRNYSNFFKGIFDFKTQFLRCDFSNCASRYKIENVSAALFKECELDESMKRLLAIGGEKRKDTAARVKSDLKQIFKAMRQGLGFHAASLNRIKLHTHLASELSYESFLRTLVSCGVLQLTDDLYSVSRGAEIDAVALCEEDHVQGVLTEALSSLLS